MITLSVPIRNSRLAVIGNALDSAAAGGLLRIYSAPRPAIGELLTEQILLVEIRLPKPSTWSLDAGKLTFASIGEALCRRSGTAAWARLLDGDERWAADLDVGLTDSGAEVELSKLALFAGGAVNVQLAEISE
ncbi:hypothetical protein LPB67_02360 [Undibacterium sp. Jales W-56]|uniref:hypothetical protein n=1 Tax=Undibacterium sp. Jales W-56 TaxID=2897325 RepID=UPI0021D116FE|nr:MULTISPECIES: hypothetical protein [Burkholderiales]MCU6432620.1 hypothetical protein [Undibacterium sp. Jales W-56]MDP3651122.1 hypothetical protein [Rhodoferax sp.]